MDKRPALRTSDKDNSFDKITAYYFKGAKLSETQEGIRKRWEQGFSLVTDGRNTPSQAADILSEQHKISKSQAFKDISNAEMLFGQLNITNKEGKRAILFELTMKIYVQANQDGDLKQMNAAMSNLIKISGVDRDSASPFDASQIQPPSVIINMNPESLGIKKDKGLDALFKDLENYRKEKENTIDIDHYEE